MNIQWDIPWIFNGVLKTFIINIEEIASVDMSKCCVSARSIEIEINEELPSYNYTVISFTLNDTILQSNWYKRPLIYIYYYTLFIKIL